MSTNFFQSKRGISEIVITLVLVLLSLVAVGIVWVVISNLLNSGTQQANLGTKCLDIDITATALVDSSSGAGTSYDLTLSRSAAGEAIAGEKVSISNSASNSGVIDFGVALSPLDTKKKTLPLSTPVIAATSVQVTPYFKDASGKEQLCSNTKTFTF